MANDWTPTEADALPWGETVEVRYTAEACAANYKVRGLRFRCELTLCDHQPAWTNERHMIKIDGTEWRRLENGR